MADIDVTFASNAGTIAREVDHAAASTTKAAAATTQLSAAAKTQGPALKAATAAVVAHGNAAAAAAAKHVTLAKAAKVVGAGHAFKEASFIGNALGAGGPGGAAMVAAVAAVKVTEAFVNNLTHASEAVERMAKSGFEFAEMVSKANAAKGKMGQDAIKEYGPSLTDLISRGGGLKEYADEIAKAGHPLIEAQKAVLEANRLFPGHERSAIAIGNDASRITGDTLSKSVSNLEGMPLGTLSHPLDAVTALVGMHRGRLTGNDETLNARDNIESNPLSIGMLAHERSSAKIDLSNQDNILNANNLTGQQIAEAVKPLEAAMTKVYTAAQEQVDIARAVYNSQSALVNVLDRLVHGRESASGKLETAQQNLPTGAAP